MVGKKIVWVENCLWWWSLRLGSQFKGYEYLAFCHWEFRNNPILRPFSTFSILLPAIILFWNQRVRTKNWVRSLLNGDNISNLLTSSPIVVIFLAQYFAGIWWLVTRFKLYLFLVRLPRVLAFHTTIAQYIRLYSNKLDLAKSKSSWCDDIKIYESFSV